MMRRFTRSNREAVNTVSGKAALDAVSRTATNTAGETMTLSPHSSSMREEFPRWISDDVEPVARHQEVRDWLRFVGLTRQENYLIDPVVDTVRMGLGWDRGVDVDASVALFDENGRTVDVIWYKKLQSTCRSVVHSGDNLTGVGDGDDEVVSVQLSEIPFHVHHLLFTVCIFSFGVSFREVRSAYVRMMHSKENYRNQEMCRFQLSDMSGNAMLMGLLTRKGSYWNFKALGTPATGRTIIELLQNPSNLACLATSPSHKPELRCITVSVIRGRGLAAKDSQGLFRKAATSDPYFSLEFRNKKYSSEYKAQTLEPEWKSPPFRLGCITEVEPKALEIRVLDYDVVGRHDFMGMVRIPGYALYNLGAGEHTFWFALGGSKEKAYRKETVSGEILINFSVEVLDTGVRYI